MIDEQEKVVLVNEQDEELGLMPKMEAHEKGVLHRAFSIFLFNDQQELLLQRRASTKYHSPGLWTNTCCSHPRENESVLEAAHRRLFEEMGISAELEQKFSFIYHAKLDKNLIEHELDHVVMGSFNGEPTINLSEVEAWKYISIEMLNTDVKANPNNYTEWFKICLAEVLENLKENSKSV